jgi:digeranylgeranylglycerophospholipid reductase
MSAVSFSAPFLVEGNTKTADGPRETYDIIVVGGGTGGCFAAAVAAAAGADVALLERKSPPEVGAIACGDALHDPLDIPDPVNGHRLVEEAIERYGAVHNYIAKGIWEDRERGHRFDISFDVSLDGGRGNVVHRHAYGQVIADECIKAGADFYADTVVQNVQHDEHWMVRASQNQTSLLFEAPLLIDAGGALSRVQNQLATDGYFADSTFEIPQYTQMSSAYRELIRTENPVPFASEEEGALLIGPTKELGYFWIFTFTPTIHNVGVGFQMSENPLKLVDVLRRELETRPAFQNATVLDKRGSAVATRRPLDSAVAHGYMAVGSAAATTSPTTGKGMEPAMQSAAIAGHYAAEAVADGDVSEEALLPYWKDVMETFGARYATQDVWNVAGMAQGVDALRGVIAAAPRNQLLDAVTAEGDNMSFSDKLFGAATYLGRNGKYWIRRKDGMLNTDQIDAFFAGLELAKTREHAHQMKQHYQMYPEDPEALKRWQETRDSLDERLIEHLGIAEKYTLPDRFKGN